MLLKSILVIVILGIVRIILNTLRHTDRIERSHGYKNHPEHTPTDWALLVFNSTRLFDLHVRCNSVRFIANSHSEGLHHVHPVPLYKDNKIVVHVKKQGSFHSPESLNFYRDKRGQQTFAIFHGQVVVEFRALTPAIPIKLTEYFSVKNDAHTCIHVDRRWAKRQVIMLPGMSIGFRDIQLLEFFRNMDVQLNVFYYESHTHARKKNGKSDTEEAIVVPECSFPSGSFDKSLRDLHMTIQQKNIEVAIGYSLGGLILSVYLARFRDTKLKKVVLLAPLLTLSGVPCNGLDTYLGSLLLDLAAPLFPLATAAGSVRIVHYGKQKNISPLGFFTYVTPIVDDDDTEDTSGWITLNFLKAVASAIRELKQVPAVETVDLLAVLPLNDQVLDMIHTEKVCRRLFKRVIVYRPPNNHNIWPCYMKADQQEILSHIKRFLG